MLPPKPGGQLHELAVPSLPVKGIPLFSQIDWALAWSVTIHDVRMSVPKNMREEMGDPVLTD